MSKTIDDKGVYQQLAKYFLDKHFVADDSTFMSTRQIRDWIKDNTKNNIDIPHGTFKIYLKDFPYIINKQRKAYLIKTRDEPVNEDELNEKILKLVDQGSEKDFSKIPSALICPITKVHR